MASSQPSNKAIVAAPSLWGYTDGDTLSGGNTAPPLSLPPNRNTNVEIANSVDGEQFKIMGRQDSASARVPLARYYASMARLIDFSPKANGTVATAGVHADVEGPAETDANGNELVKLIGVIRSINEPTARGDELYAPWELELLTTAAETVDPTLAAAKAASTADASDESGLERRVVQLYSKNVARFTGLYTGCVIGVVGTIHRRNHDGQVTALLLTRVVTPSRPTVPWSLPLASGASKSVVAPVPKASKPTRVHFCSGPFPRGDLNAILKQVALVAYTHTADALIISGPFIQEYTPNEHVTMVNECMTSFDEKLDDLLNEMIEITKNRVHIVVVPSLDDPMAFPVLPQPPFAMGGDEQLHFVSNPGEVSVNGVRFGVTSFDTIGEMREKMVERWTSMEGSLFRCAEALVSSRLYVPLTEIRSNHHDLTNFEALSIFEDPVQKKDSTNAAELMPPALTNLRRPPAEMMGHKIPSSAPHFIFAPSQKPKFAHVTHSRNQPELSAPGDGTMVINPGLMNRRQRNVPFTLSIAEVTVSNTDSVLLNGPGADGVHVRTVRIFNKNSDL